VDQYNSKIAFRGDTVDGEQAVVRTTLLLNQGAEMALNYQMHHPRNRWRVYDLHIDGISLVANYRGQFNKIIRTSSYERLVAILKSQAGFAAPATTDSGGK
jgi:phospholipid transport system substrate-binding protein